MPWKIFDALDGISASLPETLVTKAARTAAMDLLQSLPNVFRLAFFEVRLLSVGQPIDFGVCIRNSSWARRARSGLPTHRALPAWWSSIHEMVRRHLGGGIPDDNPCVWMEFDDPVSRRWQLDSPGLLLETGSSSPCLDRVREVLALSPGVYREVEKAMSALPEGGRLHYLCFMPSRRPAEVKLNLEAPRLRLREFLEAVGHPCRGAPAEDAVNRFFPTFDTLRFDLTIGEGLLPRIGFEAFSTHAGLKRRLRLLRAFETAGLCPADKARGLRRWNGTGEHRFPGHRWPSAIERRLGLKLVCGADGGLDAKAYLEFAPRFSLL